MLKLILTVLDLLVKSIKILIEILFLKMVRLLPISKIVFSLIIGSRLDNFFWYCERIEPHSIIHCCAKLMKIIYFCLLDIFNIGVYIGWYIKPIIIIKLCSLGLLKSLGCFHLVVLLVIIILIHFINIILILLVLQIPLLTFLNVIGSLFYLFQFCFFLIGLLLHLPWVWI